MKQIVTFFIVSMMITTAFTQVPCVAPHLDTVNIQIESNEIATLGRSVDNTRDIYRVCKGFQSKFWAPIVAHPDWWVEEWQVIDEDGIVLLHSVSDTLELDNITAVSGLTIRLYLARGGWPGLISCEWNEVGYEVLETDMNINYVTLNGTLVVTGIPTHYSINVNSIPNGLDYSNGYIYDGSSLIFELPNGNYQLIYRFQNHIWMNSPQCMDPLVYNTVTITNSHVAVSYIEDDASFTVFPNPTSDYFVVQADVDIKTITLFNYVGQEVLKTDYLTDQQISIADLPSGIYVILIETTDKQLVRKQLVKRQ